MALAFVFSFFSRISVVVLEKQIITNSEDARARRRRSFSKDDDQSENLNRQRGGTRRRSLRYHRSNQRAHGGEGRHSSDTAEVDFWREANARRENGEGLQHRRWKRDSHGFGAQRWRMCLEEDHI